VVKEFEAATARSIAAGHGVHPAVGRLLAARGWQDEPGLGPYLHPALKSLQPPLALRDMEAAVARTVLALQRGEKICVYGDYDVDGVTSTALLIGALRFLNAPHHAIIPHRLNDGYGMTNPRVEEAAREGCQLIITVDTGVSAVEPVRRARELGMDVVITDHHLSGGSLPDAIACVNPNLPDAPYEHGRLCGVGVAFKFAHALLKASGAPEADCRTFLRDQLDLVALGTVADVVPLLGENRVLVRAGLEVIGRTARPGIRALAAVAGLEGKPITPTGIGFQLGPRLNAAGRTEDAATALRLLLTQDKEEAQQLAVRLDELNRERQAIERSIVEASVRDVEANSETMRNLLVVGGEGWHTGVVGIVASRLTEQFDLPAIVLGYEGGLAKGSARSVPGFDIHDALTACAGHLVSFGGHAGAAGLRLKEADVPAFRRAMNDYAAPILASLDRTQDLVADVELQPAEITWQLYDDLQKLEPFGEGNPRPLFLLQNARVDFPPQVLRSEHLKVKLRAGGFAFDTIGFRMASEKETFESGGPVDILFRPTANEWNGETSLQLELMDARPTARA
jgi:single-stranded-DNA-specific exonuclease